MQASGMAIFERRCGSLDVILEPVCFHQALLCSPDAVVPDLGSINVINNLLLFQLLGRTLLYHRDVSLAVSHPLGKKKKSAAAVGDALLL